MKQIRHRGKRHGEDVTIDVEIDAGIKVMHKQDVDTNDDKTNDLVEAINTFKNANTSKLKEDGAFLDASDATEKGFCDTELAETNHKQFSKTGKIPTSRGRSCYQL